MNTLAISEEGTFFVSGAKDKKIKIWDSETGGLLKTLEGHTNFVNSVSISPDGNFIASASNDKTIKIWDRKKEF